MSDLQSYLRALKDRRLRLVRRPEVGAEVPCQKRTVKRPRIAFSLRMLPFSLFRIVKLTGVWISGSELGAAAERLNTGDVSTGGPMHIGASDL